MDIHKLGLVAGNINLFNEVICNKLLKGKSHTRDIVIYFGGDVQNYPEVMLSHRDHGKYLQWNIFNIVSLLSMKFPSSTVCVIKPKRTELKTFSCYDNFVPSNELGSPTYCEMNGALRHLKELLSNSLKQMSNYLNECPADGETCIGSAQENTYDTINLIGFSKGCVVLNQLITEIHTISHNSNAENEDLIKFWQKIRSIYWLDGGHSGGKDTWITQPSILNTLATFSNLAIHVHVTPYQVKDDRRPWIGKECKMFVDILKKAKANISYKLHFGDDVASLDNHFKVLETFKS